MKTLELIRKLYDENVDAASLEGGLSEEDRNDLRRLVEARDAVDGLPRSSPSPAVLEAIRRAAAEATHPRRSRMTLILNPRFVQRFAAAAAVVAAVGLGYLAVRPTLMSTLPETAQEEAVSNEGQESDDRAMMILESDKEEQAKAAEPVVGQESHYPAESVDNLAAAAPPARANERRARIAAPAAGEDENLDEDVASVESEAPFLFDTVGFRDSKPATAETFGRILADASDIRPDSTSAPLGWDEDRRFQTFYWQVQALSQRSPGDNMEEAVPLEGSFEILNKAKRDPGWLEANSEK